MSIHSSLPAIFYTHHAHTHTWPMLHGHMAWAAGSSQCMVFYWDWNNVFVLMEMYIKRRNITRRELGGGMGRPKEILLSCWGWDWSMFRLVRWIPDSGSIQLNLTVLNYDHQVNFKFRPDLFRALCEIIMKRQMANNSFKSLNNTAYQNRIICKFHMAFAPDYFNYATKIIITSARILDTLWYTCCVVGLKMIISW